MMTPRARLHFFRISPDRPSDRRTAEATGRETMAQRLARVADPIRWDGLRLERRDGAWVYLPEHGEDAAFCLSSVTRGVA